MRAFLLFKNLKTSPPKGGNQMAAENYYNVTCKEGSEKHAFRLDFEKDNPPTSGNVLCSCGQNHEIDANGVLLFRTTTQPYCDASYSTYVDLRTFKTKDGNWVDHTGG